MSVKYSSVEVSIQSGVIIVLEDVYEVSYLNDWVVIDAVYTQLVVPTHHIDYIEMNKRTHNNG